MAMELTGRLLAVGFVFVLLGGALWWLRQKGSRVGLNLSLPQGARWRRPGARKAMLDVIESRAVGPGAALHLVRLGDRALLVSACSGGCTLLSERPWRDLAGQPDGDNLI